jgi:small nuclear ribonucleoprotein (snRNP)-like protein
MRKEDLDKFEGKEILVVLKNGRKYSGKIIEIADTGDGLIFVTLLDKYKLHVCFTAGEIDVLEERP